MPALRLGPAGETAFNIRARIARRLNVSEIPAPVAYANKSWGKYADLFDSMTLFVFFVR